MSNPTAATRPSWVSMPSPAPGKQDGKLILVTAITPTPAGEGKTTTSVGLGDALHKLGKKVMICLREPSLGPVFGVKGGAAGGGYAQVVPMEDINLHFTGDFHAIGGANNLLAAMLDNHIYQGNALGIDGRKITWKRCMDMNDRQLRFIVDGLNGKANGTPREDGFDITVASEIMAILCLSRNLDDLKERIKHIIVGYTRDDKPVTAGELKAEGAMTALLKDAMKPNLVQTLEHTPAFIHGGPFANIAHGCNSVMATTTALKLADYVVTEAGFGADLGAEKFIDIKCRVAGIKPSAVVIVATVRALKMHGGALKKDLQIENLDALEKGLPNLLKHIENITTKFGLPAVVAINRFPTDTEAEIALVKDACAKTIGVEALMADHWAHRRRGRRRRRPRGGQGGRLERQEQAQAALSRRHAALGQGPHHRARKIYRAKDIDAPTRRCATNSPASPGHGLRQGCRSASPRRSTASPPMPISKGAPNDSHRDRCAEVRLSAGAEFVVAICGEIMTMPRACRSVPAADSHRRRARRQDRRAVLVFPQTRRPP